MIRRAGAGLLASSIGPIGWCIGVGAVAGGDPLLALEILSAALIMAWAAFVARELLRSRRLSHALAADSRETALFGVAIRVAPSLGTGAIVIGSVRPRIYVGSRLLGTLSDDEMRAVMLHEDHHRRTRAPLRAAALGGWLRLLGRSKRIRDVLVDRLTDLETLADADAIRRGSSPASIARALLKGGASMRSVSFTYAAERRVAQLLDRAAGVPVEAGRLPYEWLPVTLLTAAVLGCHAAL